MTASFEPFVSKESPWVHFVSMNRDLESAIEFVRNSGGAVIELDGSRMRDVERLFSEYAAAFNFPDYFGRNWDAFHECLVTLEAKPSPSYLSIVHAASELLSEESSKIPNYLRLMESIGKSWAHAFALGSEWGGGEVAFNTALVAPGFVIPDPR